MNETSKRILRIFKHKTSYTPTDNMVYIANGISQAPAIEILPECDEIHISCTFTWDRQWARDLQYDFQCKTDIPVFVGGPAFNSYAEDFTPGMYIRSNIIFTSRGCNNCCSWCIVPHIEGKLKELPIYPGNIIQDNNFLQTSRSHKDKVFEMLKSQHKIQFKGGLEADMIDDHFVEAVRGLKIDELWLACDTDADLPALKHACKKLTKAGFNREKIKCYALIYGDSERTEWRLREIYHAGATPFAQLYRDFTETKTEYPKAIERYMRKWQRPAIIRARMKGEVKNERKEM